MPEIPGANLFAVLAQAPTDIMGLATRQVTEAVDTFGVGMQRLSAELATPPEIAGMPGFPALPGMAPAAAPAAVSTPVSTPVTPARTVARRPTKSALIV